ncbi:helix-turn-helix domain-containing protein [Anaerocaecibacter muris]|uniref:helix-turn-helix domain-containing protein n=1 Tax=Anaerocaecibacter muris TaxID=2941513 RepID=UPI003F69258A
MQGLKQKRKARSLTLCEVARAVGVRQSTATLWEQGKAFPRKATLDKLCEFFNCKVDDLL